MIRRQTGLQRQPGHPENGVERRADLVAHVREKRALGFRRFFGAPPCRFELLDQLRQSGGLFLERAMIDFEITRVVSERFFARPFAR